jgi:hypothetical protein
MCERGMFVGCSLEDSQDTRINLRFTRKSRDLITKLPGPSSSFGQERAGRGWRPVWPNRRCSGDLGARVRLRTERGGRGGLEDVLTTGGDRWETPNFEEGWRRYLRLATAVSMAGGALALGWLRELAEEKWLGVADFMAASAFSGRLHGRRIEDGRRRSCIPWQRTASACGAQQGEAWGAARAQGQGGWGFKERGRERPCRAR